MAEKNDSGSGDSHELDPVELRKALTVSNEFELEEFKVDIKISDELKVISFKYDVKIKALVETENTNWYFNIPSTKEEVSDVKVTDGVGTLQSKLKPSINNNSCTLEFNFRQIVKKDDSYSFYYEYLSDADSLYSSSHINRFVSYNTWFIFDIHCRSVSVNLQLPKGSKLKYLFPTPKNGLKNDTVKVLENNVPPLTTISLMSVFRLLRFDRSTFIKFFGYLIGIISFILAVYDFFNK